MIAVHALKPHPRAILLDKNLRCIHFGADHRIPVFAVEPQCFCDPLFRTCNPKTQLLAAVSKVEERTEPLVRIPKTHSTSFNSVLVSRVGSGHFHAQTFWTTGGCRFKHRGEEGIVRLGGRLRW